MWWRDSEEKKLQSKYSTNFHMVCPPCEYFTLIVCILWSVVVTLPLQSAVLENAKCDISTPDIWRCHAATKYQLRNDMKSTIASN